MNLEPFIAAMGIPSAILGLFLWWLKRDIERREKERSAKEENTEKLMLMIMQTSRATNVLLNDAPFWAGRPTKQSHMARNCDNWLYYSICKEILAEAQIDIDTLLFADALIRRDELNLPPFESVRRTRQKMQAKYPELAADKEVEALREALETEYREYAIRG